MPSNMGGTYLRVLVGALMVCHARAFTALARPRFQRGLVRTFSTTLPNRPSDSPDAQGEHEQEEKKLLGPGSRVAIAGADSLLGRLVSTSTT